MPAGSTLLVFSGAALALLVIPGPSVLYIVTRSLEHGRRAGVLSVVGTHAGSVLHVAAAAYLLWLGVQRWRSGERVIGPTGGRAGMAPADRHVMRARSRSARRAERYVSTGVYVGLGVTTALSGSRRAA